MHDFIIIGGGILGMSTAMQLQQAHPQQRMVVLEKEEQLARHQSGHNSGVIHAGVYYTPGSLKARFCLEGNRVTRDFCASHGVDYQVCGKLLVATSETEMQRMRALWERTAANGLQREWLSAEALREREPNVTGLGSIFVPSSGIVDYAAVTRAMADEFQRLGGEIRLGAPVSALQERRREMVVTTPREEFTARYVVSCAGLMADRVVRMLGRDPGFSICPFRGEYYALPARHNRIVDHLIYPIPDPARPFLGVHLTRMIDGSVTVGPNAVLAFKREGYRRRDLSWRDLAAMARDPGIRRVLADNLGPGLVEMKNSLHKRGYLELVRRYCPSLELDDLTPYPAGVRAQAVSPDGKLVDDFLFVQTPRSLHVGNAPSPAATSALPIGAHILATLEQQMVD
ncbi:L-2-hydroxyglutarate oxidase [Halomonas sp. 18H]|uniref:L-2-hydroxyglutarate oxidase n=1 Tax=Halomonas almeriensis TaxID=308163 RepID=UPI0022317B86|nr:MULTISPECIES: L-2-hydroxyglutarate oxidase [Halomonas]MCW4152728.1 L-2-hydroxyglutarate oxidase [Halomonas sp. 18H]MDN3552067.1 L-2-hydroxyglutarate oxidase [Halomonas almeriensis]